MPTAIALKDARPLISGAYRDIYQHPLEPDLLIKVVRDLFIKRHAARAGWFDTGRGAGHYTALQREIEKYLLLHSRGQQDLPFIQRFAGLVETDRGFGMAVRKVCGRDGQLAPTLAAVVCSRGLDDDLLARIGELQADLIRHHIVFGDITSNNIVEADDATHGRRLVIVDGLNDHLWLPVNAMSRTLYRVYSDRRFARMKAELREIDRKRAATAGSAARQHGREGGAPLGEVLPER